LNFSERLTSLRQGRSLTQSELADLVQISRSALSLYELGKREPDFSILSRLAEFFGVTTDHLLGRSDKTTQPNPLTPKEERDLAKDLDRILSDLESDEALAFDGEPLDEETKALMKISLENSMRLAKQIAKKKFTPKKYKK